MAKLLKYLALVTGAACVAIGLLHIAGGAGSVIGAGTFSATIDSQERFYAGVFVVYGLAWIWVARRSPVSSVAIRFLAAAMLVGGLARSVSLATVGAPHPFYIAMLAVEIVVPAIFLVIASADEKTQSQASGAASR